MVLLNNKKNWLTKIGIVLFCFPFFFTTSVDAGRGGRARLKSVVKKVKKKKKAEKVSVTAAKGTDLRALQEKIMQLTRANKELTDDVEELEDDREELAEQVVGLGGDVPDEMEKEIAEEKAEEAAEVKAPSIPGSPEVPSMPESTVPGMPPMPSAPTTPGAPPVLGMPETTVPGATPMPGSQQMPGVPTAPQVPGMPQMPSAPTVPGEPPAMPSIPSAPPAMPVMPTSAAPGISAPPPLPAVQAPKMPTIVVPEGEKPKRANLKLVLNLFKIPMLRVTDVQLKAYKEILSGNPDNGVSPAIYQESATDKTATKQVAGFIDEVLKFARKTKMTEKIRPDFLDVLNIMLDPKTDAGKRIASMDQVTKDRVKNLRVRIHFNIPGLFRDAEDAKDLLVKIGAYEKLLPVLTPASKDPTQKDDEDAEEFIDEIDELKTYIDKKAPKLSAETRTQVNQKFVTLLWRALKNTRIKDADVRGVKLKLVATTKNVIQKLYDELKSGFNCNVELAVIEDTKELGGNKGKLGLLYQVLTKVLDPKWKIQLTDDQSGDLVELIVELQKDVFKSKDDKDRQWYAGSVKKAFGDGKTVLALKDKKGVKYGLVSKKEKLKRLNEQIGGGYFFEYELGKAEDAKVLTGDTGRIRLLYLIAYRIVSTDVKWKVTVAEDQVEDLLKAIIKTRTMKKGVDDQAHDSPAQTKYADLVRLAYNSGNGPIAALDTKKKKGELKGYSEELVYAQGKVPFNFVSWYEDAKDAKNYDALELFKTMSLKMSEKHSPDQRKDYIILLLKDKYDEKYSDMSAVQRTAYKEALWYTKDNKSLYSDDKKLKKYKPLIDEAYNIFYTGFDFKGEFDKAKDIGIGNASKRVNTLATLNATLLKIKVTHDKDLRKKYVELVRDLYLKAKKKKHTAIKDKLSTLVWQVQQNAAFKNQAFMSSRLGSSKPKKFSEIYADFAKWK